MLKLNVPFYVVLMTLLLTGAGCAASAPQSQISPEPAPQPEISQPVVTDAPLTQPAVTEPVAQPTPAPTPVAVPQPAQQTFDVEARQWEFKPATIRVKQGDSVTLRITSVDVEHGFTLAAYGISENLSPFNTVTVKFTADKKGSFNFFCNVYCGSGHGSMKGTLIVE